MSTAHTHTHYEISHQQNVSSVAEMELGTCKVMIKSECASLIIWTCKINSHQYHRQKFQSFTAASVYIVVFWVLNCVVKNIWPHKVNPEDKRQYIPLNVSIQTRWCHNPEGDDLNHSQMF